jgi:hypothetical protein
MTDPDNFLSRWSRKKINEKREPAGQPEPPADNDEAAPVQAEGVAQPGSARAGEAQTKPEAEALGFDLASLPSIDSIGPQTDISAFLQPGVPTEMRHAALRRAWSVDPAIRDFRGLQENDWNFNDPNGVPGFGPLPPGFDVKSMVAELFGERPKQAPVKIDEPTQQTAQMAGDSNTSGDVIAAAEAASPADGEGAMTQRAISNVASEQKDFVRCEGNSALQNNEPEKTEPKVGKPRRPHGGALPQ